MVLVGPKLQGFTVMGPLDGHRDRSTFLSGLATKKKDRFLKLKKKCGKRAVATKLEEGGPGW